MHVHIVYFHIPKVEFGAVWRREQNHVCFIDQFHIMYQNKSFAQPRSRVTIEISKQLKRIGTYLYSMPKMLVQVDSADRLHQDRLSPRLLREGCCCNAI